MVRMAIIRKVRAGPSEMISLHQMQIDRINSVACTLFQNVEKVHKKDIVDAEGRDVGLYFIEFEDAQQNLTPGFSEDCNLISRFGLDPNHWIILAAF